MKTLFLRLIGAVTGARSYITLLLVAGACAWFYVQFEQVKRDRDHLLQTAELACVAAGSSLAPAPRKRRGELCIERVRILAAIERDTASASAAAMSEALATHERKTAIDADAARRSAEAARAAANKMEKQNAQVGGDDRVGAAWFDALNDVAGLRAPGS
ncbi:MAG TPA: hypothetical protein VF628_11035 [Allosphingosinicella sp.]|jgi:hypothetical protein